ncbi:hypothetical protein ACJ77P_11715 [Syntrophus buswellii]|jgi:hypothetical protein|uniref:hypothetical protein n=1 Tax=Syntrophus TaxID=43773 RepID=UPI00345E85FD
MTDRKEFLRQTALFNAIGAAFQRALIYSDGKDDGLKDQLKRDLEGYLRRIETQYQQNVSSEKHLRTIAGVAKGMSDKHGHILKNGRFRVGIAQKAVNIYLKLLWCYGWIPEPPHCPIDSIVLAEIGDRRTKWTKMDDIEDYRDAIERIQAHIQRTGPKMSLSKWELYVWNNRRKQGVQQDIGADR